MKKCILICALLGATVAMAIEASRSQEEWNKLAQEHAQLLAEAPLEERGQVMSEWRTTFEEKAQPLSIKIMEVHQQGLTQMPAEVLDATKALLTTHLVPLLDAIAVQDGFSDVGREEMQKMVEIYKNILLSHDNEPLAQN